MDDDAKTLLAIIALVYGSSNGLGLLKTALDPIQTQADALQTAMRDPRTADQYIASNKKPLLQALLSVEVVIYVVLVILLPLFLILVLWFGAKEALALIGLGSGSPAVPSRGGSLFYWILLLLSLVSSAHLLSGYLKGWRVFAKSCRWKQKELRTK